MEDKLLETMSGVFNYTPMEVVINSIVSLVLALCVSYTYKKTHQGLSYSQSFVLTIIFVTIIIGFVLMVIGNSLARAFALVGALSIIRFRTVVKDTKDTAYIFMSLAIGMAAGTGNYFIAIYSTTFLCILAWILYKFKFGLQKSSDFILRFYFDSTVDESYVNYINSKSDTNSILHLEPSASGNRLHITYDVSLKEDVTTNKFLDEFSSQEGVTEVVLISSKNNVNY